MKKVLIGLCLIGVFVVSGIFHFREVQDNQINYGRKLASYDPQSGISYIRGHMMHMFATPSFLEESWDSLYERVNRLDPQSAELRDWANRRAILIGVRGLSSKTQRMFWESLTPTNRRAYEAARRRYPEKEYAERAKAKDEEARRARGEEARRAHDAQQLTIRLSSPNLKVEKLSSDGGSAAKGQMRQVRYDLTKDRDRAALIKLYNMTFHPPDDESDMDQLSVTAVRTEEGVGIIKSQRYAGIVRGAAVVAGVWYLDNKSWELSKEYGPTALETSKRVGSWVLKKTILKHDWAVSEMDWKLIASEMGQPMGRIHLEDIYKPRLNQPIVYIPDTDRMNKRRKELETILTLQLYAGARWSQALKQKEANAAAMEKKLQKALEDLFQREQAGRGSGSDSDFPRADRPDINHIPTPVRDPEFPPRRMIKGPETRHPSGDDGPQTGHPVYK